MHLECYCYVLHKRDMSLYNSFFFKAIVYRCLWDQKKKKIPSKPLTLKEDNPMPKWLTKTQLLSKHLPNF